MRSRFVLAVLAAAFAISAVPAAAFAAPDLGAPVAVATGDVLQASLLGQLATAAPTDALRVMVTAADADRALAAVTAAGLQPELTLDRIGVAVAVGTPAAITSLRSDRRVMRVDWADEPAQYFLETSHTATRGDQVRDGAFDLDGDGAGDRLDGTGVGIAIVDSGVDGTHPMFAGPDGSKVKVNVKGVCSDAAPILYGIIEPDTQTAYSQFSACFVDMTAVNDTDTPSIGGHGTHVAGIAGGYEVTDGAGRHLSGAAPGATLYSVSTGATISVYSGSLGLYWVLENHADPCGDGSCPPIKVVNNSWGTSGSFSASSPHAQIQRLLVEEGVTVVWAAGNDGGNGSTDNVNPFSKDPTPGVLSVANYDDGGSGSRDNALSSSSSRGQAGNIATYPDLAAPGTNITAACRLWLPICGTGFDTADPDYNTISGTSMAAPHVAGIVAVLQQAARETLGRDLTPAEVELALVDSAHPFGATRVYEPDTRNPATTTGTSFDAGHGLVDVVAAVEEVTGATPSADGGGVPCAPTAEFTDPAGDATAVIVDTPLPSEPGLDVTRAWLTTDPETGTVTFHWTVADLAASPPPTSGNGEYWDFNFSFDGIGAYVQAVRTQTDGESFVLGWFDPANNGLRSSLGSLTGSFDADADEIQVHLPADALATALGRKVVATGDEIAGLELVSRREAVVVVPNADSASGGCAYIVGAEHEQLEDPEEPGDNTAPVVDGITVSPARPKVGDVVTFTVAASDADGDDLSATWDFGDASGTADGLSVTHVYDGRGTYEVTVEVSDGTDSATATTPVEVKGGNGNGGGNGKGGGKPGTDTPATRPAAAGLTDTPALAVLLLLLALASVARPWEVLRGRHRRRLARPRP